MDKIKLGYEIGTGKEVSIAPAHMIITGLTQKAGKTTTLESFINRSKKKAIVFRTKIGEKSFLQGTIIPPFFRDRSDWQFIQGLLEATIKERLRSFERAKIIQICKRTGGNSLLEFKKKVDERLSEKKVNSFEIDILTNVQAYLDLVLPKLQSIKFSNNLELVEGLNIIDLERFARDSEVQSLIIRSVLEEVLYKYKDTIIIIPEAWKFIPQDRGNPCKLIVEEYIRQGATNNNILWIDSQDMTGVDKTPLKQITEWILGYQSEINEVKHTLDQIPLPKALKPKPDEIMSLGTGEFFLATRERTTKVYVQPFWLDDEKAKKVAMGKLKISELDAPETITPFKIAIAATAQQGEVTVRQFNTIDLHETSKRFNKELNEMSNDFFNKIADIQEQINKVYTEIFNLKNQQKQEIDEDTIVRKVMSKLPATQQKIDSEQIVSQVLSRIPKLSGAITYEVAPIEKIRKDFLLETKEKLVSQITKLDDQQKKMLKWIEQNGKNSTKAQVFEACFGKSATSGLTYQNLSKKIVELGQLELIKLDPKQRIFPGLKERISQLIQQYGANEQEIDQVYNHILFEIIG